MLNSDELMEMRKKYQWPHKPSSCRIEIQINRVTTHETLGWMPSLKLSLTLIRSCNMLNFVTLELWVFITNFCRSIIKDCKVAAFYWFVVFGKSFPPTLWLCADCWQRTPLPADGVTAVVSAEHRSEPQRSPGIKQIVWNLYWLEFNDTEGFTVLPARTSSQPRTSLLC